MAASQRLTSVELCAGAGGQALGLEMAGFMHQVLVDNDPDACATLKSNRPEWNVVEQDVRDLSGRPYRFVNLLAAGVPCPPFSTAGRGLGRADDRDLFPTVLRIARECQPEAVVLENVPGILQRRFHGYRQWISKQLLDLDFVAQWERVNAVDFGVPQVRTRVLCVAVRKELVRKFDWPAPRCERPVTVGDALRSAMESAGWEGALAWAERARRPAPVLVGGSKKHGGADLGPVRSKLEWAKIGVDAWGVADTPPKPGFSGSPRLTVQMAAVLQGFPSDWHFEGKKTSAYRQVGNAFPPPVASAIGEVVAHALEPSRGREDFESFGVGA